MSSHGIESRDEKETTRIEAFSDGVFAIATTLLVLEIKVPLQTADGHEIESAQELMSQLVRLWPSYFGYVLGFVTIAIMWLNHHTLFRLIRRADHGLLLWNSLLLLVIAAIPFPTGLAAEYIARTDGTEKVAAVVYSGVGVVLSLCYNFLWWHMSKGNRLIDNRSDPKEVDAVTHSYYFGPVLYAVAVGLSFYNGWAGLGTCFLLAVFFALPNGVVNKLRLRR